MRTLLTTTVLLLFVICLNAQSFTRGVDLYSKKKPAYITLTSGEEVVGEIDKVKRKKGQIESIRLEMENGDEVEYTPNDIKHAFLPASGLDKFAKDYDDAFNATTWGKDSPEGERIKDGYAYFQTELVQLKKEEATLLMQVVNPHFNDRITVYFDPMASESGSMSLGGIQVAGGLEKSYYIKVGDEEKVWRLKKKDYDETLEKLYGDCDKIKPEEARKIFWDDFPLHVYNYSTKCGE
jgi:hypothetical protein